MRAAADLSTPAGRAAARRDFLWKDHGILRTFWTNFAEIAPGAYRSNHPDHTRLTRYKEIGITAVLNLRGVNDKSPYVMEAESCAKLGLTLHSVSLKARRPADRGQMLALFDAFDTIPRPFVMHCKSGADRAGLASALYLLDRGAPLEQAQQQLSLRYLHLSFTKTGVQDHMLELYGARLAQGPIAIRDWVRDEYAPEALAASFAQKRILPV